ncbi:MAG: nucleotidyltransferase domain-containing protein [Patescibacteria group bacterium]
MNEMDTKTMVDAVRPIAERAGLSLVVLFGSYATGREHAQSDTDIAVLAERTFSPSELATLAYELSQNLKNSSIDISDLRTGSPLLLRTVAHDGIVLFEREPHAFALFQMYAFKRFVEAKPLRDLRRASLEQFVAPTL